MSKRFLVAIAAVAVAATLLAARKQVNSATPALTRSDEPGGTYADAKLASTNPDEYAWQLFFFINRQASDDAAGIPDPKEATLADNKPGQAVVWEGWALASGERESEVFNGCHPKPWKNLTHRQMIPGTFLSPNLTESVDNKLAEPKHNEAAFDRDQQMLSTIPPTGLESQVEIRYNRETYESILQDGLWSREAIDKRVRDALGLHESEFVTFPVGAKAVKAAWVEICIGQSTDCPDLKRYHWREVDKSGRKHIYGLAALHIMTREKRMPHWFWADFIHEDCLENNRTCTLPNPQAPDGPPRDSTTTITGGVRPETIGSPWENYRLMGTETDFQCAGHDNELSNPVIETGPGKTSCITCHDYASTHPINVPAEDLPTPGNLKVLGVPDESVLYEPVPAGGSSAHKPARVYVQSDFLWSIEKLARSKQSCPSN